MQLETFDGWTIDRRLKQLRKVNNDDKILFVDFDSDLGDLIFQKKILSEELSDLNYEMENEQRLADDYNNGNIDPMVNIIQTKEYQRLTKELKDIQVIIEKLEKEQK